jgi:hypothetical protein
MPTATRPVQLSTAPEAAFAVAGPEVLEGEAVVVVDDVTGGGVLLLVVELVVELPGGVTLPLDEDDEDPVGVTLPELDLLADELELEAELDPVADDDEDAELDDEDDDGVAGSGIGTWSGQNMNAPGLS